MVANAVCSGVSAQQLPWYLGQGKTDNTLNTMKTGAGL